MSKEYKYSEVDDVMGKINHQLWEFRRLYAEKPKFILISEDLEMLFNVKMNLLYDREMVILDDEPLKISRIFGTICIVSKELQGLEFEVR